MENWVVLVWPPTTLTALTAPTSLMTAPTAPIVAVALIWSAVAFPQHKTSASAVSGFKSRSCLRTKSAIWSRSNYFSSLSLRSLYCIVVPYLLHLCSLSKSSLHLSTQVLWSVYVEDGSEFWEAPQICCFSETAHRSVTPCSRLLCCLLLYLLHIKLHYYNITKPCFPFYYTQLHVRTLNVHVGISVLASGCTCCFRRLRWQ